MTMRSRAQKGGRDQFSIYEASAPWGPWHTVFYTNEWDVDLGEAQQIPSKWISREGKSIYLVFSGNDALSVRGAELRLATD